MWSQTKKVTVSLSLEIGIYGQITDQYARDTPVDVTGKNLNFSAYVSHLIHMGLVYKTLLKEKETQTPIKKKKG